MWPSNKSLFVNGCVVNGSSAMGAIQFGQISFQCKIIETCMYILITGKRKELTVRHMHGNTCT